MHSYQPTQWNMLFLKSPLIPSIKVHFSKSLLFVCTINPQTLSSIEAPGNSSYCRWNFPPYWIQCNYSVTLGLSRLGFDLVSILFRFCFWMFKYLFGIMLRFPCGFVFRGRFEPNTSKVLLRYFSKLYLFDF